MHFENTFQNKLPTYIFMKKHCFKRKCLSFFAVTGAQNVHTFMRGSRGGDRGPSGKSQKYRGFSNTGPDPLKIARLPSQHLMLGINGHASETPFK